MYTLQKAMEKGVLGVFVCLLLIGVASAQTPEELTGRWEGSIHFPDPLGVIVMFSAGEGLTGTIDIPEQGNTGLALTNVVLEGSELRFEIEGVPGEPTFVGEVAGEEFSGTFSQSGQAVPFTLTRQAELSGEAQDAALAQGRRYTELFYAGEFAELAGAFSSEMLAAVGAQEGLETFRQQIEDQLGAETQVLDEQVFSSQGFRVYERTAVFEKVGTPFDVEWTFDENGVVEGFFYSTCGRYCRTE